MALLLEDQGRHAHRQPRRRDVEQLPLLRDARQLSRLARREDRQGALARQIADFDQQYFSTMAPIVVGNHVLVGTGNDLDAPGFLQSFDPETGKLQWKFYTVPMNAGDPGSRPGRASTRRGTAAGRSGSRAPTIRRPSSTSSAPAIRRPATPAAGRKGDNLFTCSLVAVNVDTGKMAWYFQTSPHDTHDWDSAQTPILIDGDDQRQAAQTRLDGGAQRLLLHARSRHRRALVTSKYGTTTNWAKGLAEAARRSRSREGSDDSGARSCRRSRAA